jgi:hypothetical protein
VEPEPAVATKAVEEAVTAKMQEQEQMGNVEKG